MIALRDGRLAVVLAAFVFLLAAASPLTGQTAWTPVKREANVSFAFQHINLEGHFWSDGSKHEGDVPSSAQVAIVQLDYGLTDKLAFTARLPYIASKFTVTDDPGTIEFLEFLSTLQQNTPGAEGLQSIDTGSYYATFQDFGFTLRYNAMDRLLVVTPLMAVTIPSHDYRTVGEASPGQNRLALHTGVNVGRLLDPLLPSAYVHARYTYSFVQRLRDVSINRSNAEVEAGYGVTPLLSVRVLAAWSQTHGGFKYDELFETIQGPNPSLEDIYRFLDHDRLLSNRYWHLGAGATVALADSFDLDAAFIRFLSGADTHYGLGVTVGATWRFAPPFRANPSKRFSRRHW